MNNKYVEKALSLVKVINKKNDINEKLEIIHHLTSYCSCLYYCGYISQKEFIYIMTQIENDPTFEISEIEQNSYINELLQNNLLLRNFYLKYFNIYKAFFATENIEEPNIKKDIYPIFKEFIKYMNAKDLFYSLLFKKRITFDLNIIESMCVNDRYNSYILIKRNNSFNKILDLSHELGHAYENRVMHERKIYFERTYNAEIISILFTRILKQFIFDKGILKSNEINQLVNYFELNYYNFIKSSIFLNYVIEEGDYQLYDYEIFKKYRNATYKGSLTDNNYAIGNIISINLFNEWQKNDRLFVKKLPELIREIDNMKLKDLLKTYDNKELVENTLKRLIK